MSNPTTTQKNPPLSDLAEVVKKLNLSERETLEMLLDTGFTKTVIKRNKEIERLRKQNRLLSFEELKKSLSK